MNFFHQIIIVLLVIKYVSCAGRYDLCRYNDELDSVYKGFCDLLSDCKNSSGYYCDYSFVCCEASKVIKDEEGFGGHMVISNKEFPHMALIGYDVEEGENPWRCAGSLITSLFILSAAHCNADVLPNFALLGVTDYERDYDKGEHRSIIQIIDHPEYDFNAKLHDICLYRLNATVLSKTVCLPESGSPIPFELVATGWGTTSLFSGMSEKLIKMELNLWNRTKCTLSYNETNQICAGSDKRIDTCSGDSGGPLQTKPIIKELYFQVDGQKCLSTIYGIVSYGKACLERSGTSSIYTKVSSYLKWIKEIVWYGTMDCEL